MQSWQKPMGKSIKTPLPKSNVGFLGVFVVFKWDFLLSTKYFLTLIFWGCHSKSFFSYLRYSGIVDSKRFHLKTTKWKFLLSTFPEYQSKKKVSNNIASGEGEGDLLPKVGLTMLTCCNSQSVFARVVALLLLAHEVWSQTLLIVTFLITISILIAWFWWVCSTTILASTFR